MNQVVLAEVKSAYEDVWNRNGDDEMEGDGPMERRKLMFKASQSVSVADAYEIMKEAVPGGYNEFEAELLKKLPDDCEVILAREYSVCVYVKPGVKRMPSRRSMGCDEFNKGEDGLVRIWWD